MAKFSNPLGQGKEVWISQTDHGASNRAIDIGSVQAGQAVYAVADGKVLGASSGSGSYCYQSINGSDIRVWYVHTYNWKAKGTVVKKGDKICEIAPSSKNGGHPVHLHFGITPKTYSPMSYLDRSIVFKTKYADISKSWFVNGSIKWSLFPDKSYLPLYKKGDKLKIIQDMNVRQAPSGTKIGVAKKGSVCKITTSGEYNNGYTWYLCEWADASGYLADTSYNDNTQDAVTNLDGSEPVDETEALKAEIERLELIIEAQREEIDALNQKIQEQDEEIEELSGVAIAAKEFCTAHANLEGECNKL